MLVLGYVFKLLAPYDCLSCGREGELLCDGCQTEVLPLPPRCYKCLKPSVDSQVCEDCRRNSALTHVWVGTDYEGVIKQLIHKYKFERAQDCATLLAALLKDALPYLPEETIITYVPTASSRVRQRGYDQAKLLAKAFARLNNRKIAGLLVRHGQTRQVGASRIQRTKQLQHAFEIRKKVDIKDRKILLIDDILTTGATLEIAAQILINAGVKSVDALAVAQKQ